MELSRVNHETLVIDRMQRFHFLAYCNLSDTSGLSNNLQYKLYIYKQGELVTHVETYKTYRISIVNPNLEL